MERSLPPLEVWAGVECTHNRVHNRRFDQLTRTGHRDRPDDIERLASLGVAAVRYPVLWEHVCGDEGSRRDWRWADERLAALRDHGIRPVVGLLHHGAGPGDAGFADPRFPDRFADYARAVAERYPWISEYIPINEPLTTARFSGLYGVWHPHARDPRVFARIVLAEVRATVLAIRAIREIVPDARLVQTEDIGTIRATPPFRYQAEFENERRWVAFDLLCGALEPGMRMWDELIAYGVAEEELEWFADNPVAPDVIGCDNYLTSDRLLDHRVGRYPEWSHGGNGRDRYADIEAARVTREEPAGILPVLREAWKRYGRPVAVGEAHLGSTREEQLRWLRDVWRSVETARAEGIDVRAVTTWSVFGAYDWNTLVTRDAGYYEPGAFDVRGERVRPTAIATMVRALATGEAFDHPALDGDGWWTRRDRWTYPVVGNASPIPSAEPSVRARRARPRRRLLFTGEDGATLTALERIADVRRLDHAAATGETDGRLDLDGVWAVIDVAGCRASDHSLGRVATTVATDRTRVLAAACSAADIPLVVVSCHHAGGGARDAGCGVFSRAREAAASDHRRALVVRTGALLDPWDPADPLVRALAGAARPAGSRASASFVAYVPDALNTILDLLIDGVTGAWDVDHGVRVARRDLERAATALGRGIERDIGGVSVPRGENFVPLPSLADALARFVAESRPLWDRRASGRDAAPVVTLDAGPAFEFPADEPASTLSRADEEQAG